MKGINPETATKLYMRTISIHECESSMNLIKHKGNLLAVMGLTKYSHTTPIIQALDIRTIYNTIGANSLNLKKVMPTIYVKCISVLCKNATS